MKEEIMSLPASFEFSSYLEYWCGMEIGSFGNVHVQRASERFLTLLKWKTRVIGTAEDLQQYLNMRGRGQGLDTGAAILGWTAVASEFVEDVWSLPMQHHWAIWFCVEVIEHIATNNLFDEASSVVTFDGTRYHVDVPSGVTITYDTLPITWTLGQCTQNRFMVHLHRAQDQNSEMG